MISGKLHIVSTPIGNLKDITYRAIEVLKAVDLIAAEDTRHTGILLKHHGITTRQIAYHDHNKKKITPHLLAELKAGKNIAIVSDAGTPGISDPGYYLIRECLSSDIEVEAIPGPSSLLAGLVISGLPTDRFCFEGFLPKASGKLKKRLLELREEPRTLVFFESPYRLAKTLAAMFDIFGDRRAYVGRELTKKFEQSYRGTITDLLNQFGTKAPRGECVLIVAGRRTDNDPNLIQDRLNIGR